MGRIGSDAGVYVKVYLGDAFISFAFAPLVWVSRSIGLGLGLCLLFKWLGLGLAA